MHGAKDVPRGGSRAAAFAAQAREPQPCPVPQIPNEAECNNFSVSKRVSRGAEGGDAEAADIAVKCSCRV